MSKAIEELKEALSQENKETEEVMPKQTSTNNTVLAKLAKARLEVQQLPIHKGAYNDYSKYKYLVLEDFLYKATEILYKNDLIALFDMNEADSSKELNGTATLTIEDFKNPDSDNVIFSAPVSIESISKGTTVQKIGAAMTYYKRYLYISALELAVPDEVDAQPPVQDINPKELVEINNKLKTILGQLANSQLEPETVNKLKKERAVLAVKAQRLGAKWDGNEFKLRI